MRPEPVVPEQAVESVRRDGRCDVDVRGIATFTDWLDEVYDHARRHDLRLSHVTVGDVVTLVDIGP